MLSTTFGDELFGVLYPHIRNQLTGAEWRSREASILALGAVSEGCHTALMPSLPDIVALLVPLVRRLRFVPAAAVPVAIVPVAIVARLVPLVRRLRFMPIAAVPVAILSAAAVPAAIVTLLVPVVPRSRFAPAAVAPVAPLHTGCGCNTCFFDSWSLMLLHTAQVKDPRPMVRIITCWALGRFSHWVLQQVRSGLASRRQCAPDSLWCPFAQVSR